MNKAAKILLFTLVLGGAVFTSFADRGIRKKKNKVTLNVDIRHASFQKSLAYNIYNGLKYTGSLVSAPLTLTANGYISTQLITYEKGNSVYIVPVEQKVIVSEVRPGYTGMKLIIRKP